MLREEKVFGKVYCILILVFAFLVIYSPLQLGSRELYWQEGYYAVQALEMNMKLPITVAHGEVIQNSFPLFPWLVRAAYSYLQLPMEFAARGISVLSLAVIACIVWGAARSAKGVQAAVVATAMVISCNVVSDKSVEGYPQTLMIVFLMAAWLSWFWLGAGRGEWDFAWVVALFFAGLAFYTSGFLALLYFAFPLLFMRRPLSVWPKLNRSGFWVGCAFLAGFILLWGIPYLLLAEKLPFTSLPLNELSHYLDHLLEFPLDVMIRLLPWSILAWAPFCVALFPLDSTPIYSRFLRTIVISLFFILWLNPFTEARDMMILVPPLAILTGINYWILARRYGDRIIKLLLVPGILLILPAALLVMFYYFPDEWGIQHLHLMRGDAFRDILANRVAGSVAAGLLLMISCYLVLGGRQRALWVWLLLLTCCWSLFSWGIIIPYRAQENEKRSLGAEMRQALAAEEVASDEPVYKAKILDLYNECFYMGRPVRKIASLDELPKNKKTVYLISTEFPQVPERRWRNLIPERKEYRSKRLCLYQGVLSEEPKGPESAPPKTEKAK